MEQPQPASAGGWPHSHGQGLVVDGLNGGQILCHGGAAGRRRAPKVVLAWPFRGAAARPLSALGRHEVVDGLLKLGKGGAHHCRVQGVVLKYRASPRRPHGMNKRCHSSFHLQAERIFRRRRRTTPLRRSHCRSFFLPAGCNKNVQIINKKCCIFFLRPAPSSPSFPSSPSLLPLKPRLQPETRF